MASVTFKRGTKAEIENTQIQDGQLLMETDQLNNNKIYLDLPNGTRVPVGGSGAWVGTKKEFEVAVEEGKIADGTQVIITDDYESGITASMTLYSNAQSGLVATNVQSAIDEVSAKIGQENISQVGNSVTGAINNLNSNLDLCNDFGSLYFINSFNYSTDTLVTWGYIKCRYFLLSIESEIEGTRINSIMIPTSQNGSDILYSSYKQHIISGKNISDADCKAIFKPESENSATIRTVNCSLKLYAIK